MKEKEEQRLNILKEYEKNLYNNGTKCICGIDEAGRGPLAGPVVVASVILPTDSMIEGVNDSKKLSEAKRKKVYEEIIKNAIDWSVGIVDNNRIDEINILNATKEALTLSVHKLKVKPSIILVDALEKINTEGIPYDSIIKGDAKVYSIAAASIIAKVTRDTMMYEWDKQYPEYGFAGHKGYGTAKHIQAIKEHGICKIHRKTFVKNFIA